MSGDSHNKDDADFLDEEDFVVEDIAGKNDDLEDLFDEPAEPAVDDPSKKADEEKDEDDLLFTDHTEGLEASEEFQKPTFAEDKDSEWDGELLDLESVGVDPVGVPEASIEDEEAAADPQLEEVKETFAAELDSMLSDEEDFALDSEIDLEVVGDGAEGAEDGDGISEFEQSGPFVLDDGEGLWSDELEDGEQVDEAVEPATAAAADVDAFELPEAAEVAGEEFDDEAEVANPFVNVTHELPPVDAAEAPTLVTEGPYDALDEIVEGPRAAAGDDEATFEDMQLLDAADGAEAGGPGWEPLPSTSMNELSEVDEVQRTDEVEYDTSGYEEDETYEDAEGEEYDDGSDEGYGPEDLEDVDGHDIYAEDDEHDAVVVGAMPPRRRAVSLLLSLAASLMVVGLCATVVVRPEWFGLEVEPEQVARVEVPRPRIAVDVPEPPQLGEQVVSVEGVGQPIEGQPTEGQPTEGPSTVGQATEGQPTESQPTEGPSTGGQPGEGDPAVAAGGGTESPTQPEGQPAEGQPTAGTPAEGQPQLVNNQQTEIPTPGEAPSTAATDPDGLAQGSTVADPATEGATGTDPATVVVEAPEPAAPNAWPVAETTKQPEVEAEGQQLARFGDDLLVGGLGQGSTASANALDGVMPGSRAFAQLHNGNYFIGRVKQVAAETITLRVETGEVTLPTGEIAQLTRLGSSDYEELQKATKGFVRLTNNNRLVGGILSRIADDHVVLEFRSNRVMLPKSAVGEIVSGEGDGRVRLDTTTEEDNWLRKVAERELGTGRGAESQPKPQVPAGSSRSGPPK